MLSQLDGDATGNRTELLLVAAVLVLARANWKQSLMFFASSHNDSAIKRRTNAEGYWGFEP
jgi:hypothetical protein